METTDPRAVLERLIQERGETFGAISKLLGRKVIPHVEVDPGILGGIIIRYGDRRMDGSLRRRLSSLRRRLKAAALPETIATTAGDSAAPQVGA